MGNPTDPHQGLKPAAVVVVDAGAPAPGGTNNPPAPEVPPEVTVTFDEFCKVDIRVGTIVAAERVPKSDKLLKLQVHFGGLGDRQILAGIGKSFQPSDLIGFSFTFVVNLPPRKMMGLESHGMILATGTPEALTLLQMFGPFPGDGARFG
jgi:methionyl-tRNA synthetase